jgi:hypothetical protein
MSLPNFLMRKRFCLNKISIHLILRSVNLSLSLHIIVNDSKAFCLHYLFSFICYCLFSATKQWGKTHYEVLLSFIDLHDVFWGRFFIFWFLYRLETKKSSREIEHAWKLWMRIHLNIDPIVKYPRKYVKYGFLLTSAAVCFFGGMK